MKWEYICNEEMNIYYVPRAPSICEARSREEALKEAFGDDIQVFIVSPFEWSYISNRGKVEILEE